MLVKLAKMFDNLTDCIKRMTKKTQCKTSCLMQINTKDGTYVCFERKLNMLKTSDTDTVKV